MPLLIALFVIGVILFFVYLFLLAWVLILIVGVAFLPLMTVAIVGAYVMAASMPLVYLVKIRDAVDGPNALPSKLKRGEVLGEGPRGEMHGHGWDKAWPTYFPHQAKTDFHVVVARMWRISLTFLRWPWRVIASVWNRADGLIRWLWWVPIIVAMVPLLAIPFTIFSILLIVLSCAFMGVLYLVMAAIAVVSRGVGMAYGFLDRSKRKRESRTLQCTSTACYRTTLVPGFRCPGCGQVHRLLVPGPLGIFSRLCECGTKLPTTASRASKLQFTVVCPYCDVELGVTAGSRPTVLVPVIGPVGAGKTTFFASAVQGMAELASAKGGSFEPGNPVAGQFLQLVRSGGMMPKTAVGRPEVMAFEARTDGEVHDLQLVDAAGEHFVNWDSSQQLTYIDSASAWVLIVDPLMFSEVRARLEEEGVHIGTTLIGSGDMRDAYASVVDRYKASAGSLRGKSLAIVLSKADVLAQVPEWEGLGSPESVRELLLQHGGRNLLTGAELDFSKIDYFAAESRTREGLDPRRDPVAVIDWALSKKSVRLKFLETDAAIAPDQATLPAPAMIDER